MPRVKGGSASDQKRKKLFEATKGYFGRKKNVFRRAQEAYLHSMSKAFKDRRAKKRDFRRLWITRISAAARMNEMTYSSFMNGLKRANIDINRKVLADLAVQDMPAFAKLVDQARGTLVQ